MGGGRLGLGLGWWGKGVEAVWCKCERREMTRREGSPIWMLQERHEKLDGG